MFDINDFVWVEYDSTEAYVGVISSLTEDEIGMVQIYSYRMRYDVDDRRLHGIASRVEDMDNRMLRDTLLASSIKEIVHVVRGREAMKRRLVELSIDVVTDVGYPYIENFTPGMRIVLPRAGCVIKEGYPALYCVVGKPEDSAESAETSETETDAVEPTEAEIEDAVEDFSEKLRAWENEQF